MDTIKCVLDGCDISFLAEAPRDITLEQLLKQADKIKPMWCACGICSYEKAKFTDDTPQKSSLVMIPFARLTMMFLVGLRKYRYVI